MFSVSTTIERAQQLSQMRHVYDVGGARRVVVWLGEEDNAKSLWTSAKA